VLLRTTARQARRGHETSVQLRRQAAPRRHHLVLNPEQQLRVVKLYEYTTRDLLAPDTIRQLHCERGTGARAMTPSLEGGLGVIVETVGNEDRAAGSWVGAAPLGHT
jgi:hypothetical protein